MVTFSIPSKATFAPIPRNMRWSAAPEPASGRSADQKIKKNNNSMIINGEIDPL